MECPAVKAPDWLAPYLENPRVTDICINGTHGIFIDQGHGLERILAQIDCLAEEVLIRNWILHELSLSGKSWDAKFPFMDATLQTGHRLHIVFPPISQKGLIVSLRRLSSCLDKEEHRWQNSSLYLPLVEAVRYGDSVIIAGATGSGKTTLARDLIGKIPENERILALEDTPELHPTHPHFLSLVSRPSNADGFGEVNLRTLLKQTLRMRPDRIVLGECRGNEVLELLQALNTGHRGALATLHANSPRDALRRIELLCLLASQGTIPIPAIRELLANGVQWIVHVKKMGLERKINELWRIEGREGDTILMRQVIECKTS